MYEVSSKVRHGTSVGLIVLLSAVAAVACDGQRESEDTSTSAIRSREFEENLVHSAHLIDCLQERGFAAEVDTQTGGVTVRAQGQEAALELATEECVAEMREDGILPPIQNMSPEFLATVYETLLQVEVCLEDKGYPIEDAPSLDVFISSYSASDGPWHPYLYLPDSMGEAEMGVLMEACPAP